MPDLTQIFSLPHYFINRVQAEDDPTYKQIIPYQLFFRNGRFFVYQRGSEVGEGRLAGCLSVGIGGHINQEDADNNCLTLTTYRSALLRERQEELLISDNLGTSFIGWINDDSDLVGQVHMGAVHCCKLSDKDTLSIRGDDEDIHSVGWWTATEIMENKAQFEKWALLALSLAKGTLS